MMSVGFIFDSLGAGEILLVLAAALLLFGAERLPELARMLGRAMSELRRSAGELTHIITDDGSNPPSAPKKSVENKHPENDERREG